MKYQRIFPVCAALILLCSAGAAAQEKTSLQYRFQPGSTYLYADTVRSNQTQEMMGQEMKITSVIFSRSRMVAEPLRTDGATPLVTSVDSMLVSSKSPMRDTTMVMKDLLGKRTRLFLTPQGEVAGREVIDSIKLAGIMMRGISSREIARFHRFSKEPVAVGGTWKSNAVDSTEMMGGKIYSRFNVEYTVNGTSTVSNHSCLMISYKGDIGIDGKGSMMGNELYMEGKGKNSGSFAFDPALGIVIREDSTMDTDMTAAVTGQQNMTIPITQNARTSHVLLEIQGAAK